jgi:hypothetical protein
LSPFEGELWLAYLFTFSILALGLSAIPWLHADATAGRESPGLLIFSFLVEHAFR